MKSFRIADEARCDIRRIAAYYKKTSGSNHWFLDQVDEAIEHLVRFPASGHHRNELKNPSLRCWVFAPYILIYRTEADVIVIVSVVHSSRDLFQITESLHD